eukprot:gene19394-26044_t
MVGSELSDRRLHGRNLTGIQSIPASEAVQVLVFAFLTLSAIHGAEYRTASREFLEMPKVRRAGGCALPCCDVVLDSEKRSAGYFDDIQGSEANFVRILGDEATADPTFASGKDTKDPDMAVEAVGEELCKPSPQAGLSPVSTRIPGSTASPAACGHGHKCGHSHHNTETWLSQKLENMGLLDVVDHMAASSLSMMASIACFMVALILNFQCLEHGLTAERRAILLSFTYILSGVPQIHVLMILAALGSLYMGMAQEGALLLLLFHVSHTLEEMFTSAAQGSLEKLFNSIPAQATVVQLDSTGAPLMSSASQLSSKSIYEGVMKDAVMINPNGDSDDTWVSLLLPVPRLPSQATVVQLDGTGGPSMSSATVVQLDVTGAPLMSSASQRRAEEATVVQLDVTGAPLMSSASQRRAEEVALGQYVLVKPAEQVPLDGQVVWGAAHVSMQHISGESCPVRLSVGASVPAGSSNLDGLLVVQVTATSVDSTPSRIAQMAEAAQSTKPKLQNTLDQVGEILSKAVLLVTVATLVILLALGVPLTGPRGALYRAMGVLTAGSPCAVFLVPLAYVCALATITHKGVLVKSAATLDMLSKCSIVALDKTGTNTTGSLTMTDAVTFSHCVPGVADGQDGDPDHPLTDFSASALRYAVALSEMSNHPMSRAIVKSCTIANSSGLSCSTSTSAESSLCSSPVARSQRPDFSFLETADSCGSSLPELSECDFSVHVTELEQVPGAGVKGVCSFGANPAVAVRLGSLDFVKEVLPEDGPLRQRLEQEIEDKMSASSSAKATSFLVVTPLPGSLAEPVAGTGVAMFSFEDAVRADVQHAVQLLQEGSWRSVMSKECKLEGQKIVVMLTGDKEQVAKQVADLVGIEHYLANLKPEDKLAYINDNKPVVKDDDGWIKTGVAASGGLLMMGDGINDAPALAAAHVGVAVADSLGDVVASAADIIVLNGQGVANLPWLFRIACQTQQVVQQNLILAFLAMFFAVVPTVAGFFPLWLAVLLHEGSTVLVALNSLRLLLDPDNDTMFKTMSNMVEKLDEMFRDAWKQQHTKLV